MLMFKIFNIRPTGTIDFYFNDCIFDIIFEFIFLQINKRVEWLGVGTQSRYESCR